MEVLNKRFSVLYFVLMAVLMLAIMLDMNSIRYAVMPMFMPLLMILLHLNTRPHLTSFTKLVQFGLFFSWLGDIALMLPNQTKTSFLFGLVFFLIAHLGYITAFISSVRSSSTRPNILKCFLTSLPFFIITLSFYIWVRPSLPDGLQFPVLAYSVVISLMGSTSTWRSGHVNRLSFYLVMTGAVLFILSDCLLASNAFVIKPEAHSALAKELAIMNMLLYLSGQLLIALGAGYSLPAPTSHPTDH